MNVFQIFYLLLLQKDISSAWQSTWIRLWTVTSLFCSMSRVAGWYPLKKITKHESLLYLCIIEKFLSRLEKHLRRGLFCKSCGITDHSLLKVKINRNLPKVLIVALKDKKRSYDDTKENLLFKQS